MTRQRPPPNDPTQRRLRLPLPEHLPRQRAALLAARTGHASAMDPIHEGETRYRSEREAAAYDLHFGVERVSGPASAALLAAMSTAYRAVLADVAASGTTLSGELWRELLAARDVLLPATPDALPSASPPRGPLTDAAALHRWQTGHWLFFALVQGLIVALSSVRDAAERGDGLEVRAGLDLASLLTVSSAAAMHYASDFPPDLYEGAVRPSMAPPFVAAGFSGLQGRDHRHLMRAFGRLRALPVDLTQFDAYQDFMSAVGILHRAHRRVCAQFVDDQPSLRQHTCDGAGLDLRSATSVLDALSARRLALLPPARVPRRPG